MSHELGTRRGLDQCATAAGHFAVLALVHRQNLRKELRPDDPTSVTFDEMVTFKLAVVRALGDEASGLLLDPEVGVAPAIATGALRGSTGLLVAIEATGYEGTAGARTSRVLPGWSVAAAKQIGASAAKLLLYYHPDAPTAGVQEQLLASVAGECRRHDLALFVEPLSYGLDGRPLTGEERRAVVVETARRLTAIGGDVLKAEFPYDAAVSDPGRWADACAELDEASARPWVLLSGGVDDATFEAQLRVACAAGACGALAGRSVWSDAARMGEPARSDSLRTASRDRLRRLADVIGEHGHSWVPRWEAAVRPVMPGEGWFVDP
jgi:tagatose-1,6-bisphosphate aldolase